MVKLAKNSFIICAVSGTAACNMQVKDAIKKGCQSADDLLEYVDKDSYALILTPDGILKQAQDGVLWPCKNLATIGSGGNLALGFIAGHLSATGSTKITPGLARKAIHYTSKHRSDCGGGCDIRQF
jgi:ATP-dependent protease HslVU (ClpYQ) peptidase subunit